MSRGAAIAAAFVLALSGAGEVRVRVDPSHVLRAFDPLHALGAGVDGHERGEVARMLSPANVRAMRSAGFHPLSYRLRTELAIEAWHWNPSGTWSDAARQQGYWTSSAIPAPGGISVSYGYRLPRRGSTFDQANRDGYSRLDDGDPRTFWKSNPYLDQTYTRRPNRLHPQWVLIDLGQARPIREIRIRWGEPYATEFRVEYSHAKSLRLDLDALDWKPAAAVSGGQGGDQRIATRPVTARLLRLLLLESSGAVTPPSKDIRDRLGFAIREISAGTPTRDWIRHAPDSARQSVVYVSSTDPWHRASDRDTRIEQPGFDRIFRDGLTNGLPAMIPAGVLYDTPENAAAEVRYLRAQGYAAGRVELGEEPDGQFASPAHFAALYAQVARAIHQADPRIETGGPSFQDIEEDSGPWMKRFLAWLGQDGSANAFSFFSFEWYPFDDVCESTQPQLLEAPERMREAIRILEASGLSRKTPWVIAEYGYSAFGARAEVDLEGALLNAEIAAQFLSEGGDQAFLYGYEPNELIQERACTWGNNMLFLLGPGGAIRDRTATYWGAQMLTQEWALPSGGTHRILSAATDDRGVAAYAVERPDQRIAILLLNKYARAARTARVQLAGAAISGTSAAVQFSRKQYEWKASGENGHPVRSLPPDRIQVNGGVVSLPAYSMTVLTVRAE